MRHHNTEETITHPGGASSTRKPHYALVPRSAFEALVSRFELGESKYAGRGCWNALSENRVSGLTREWVTARLEHVINHALVAIGKLHGNLPDDGDDDAGALMFGGAALAEYNRLQKGVSLADGYNPSSVGGTVSSMQLPLSFGDPPRSN